MAQSEFVFVAVGARDAAAADALVDVLRTAPSETSIGAFDVVCIGRKRNGEARFLGETSDPTRAGSGVSVAAGLGAALYPSVGADLPGRAVHRAALNAVAGRVADALGRKALMQFGELLDASTAAVIAVARVADRDALRDALADCDRPVVRTASLDTDELERVAAVARAAAPPGNGATRRARGDQSSM